MVITGIDPVSNLSTIGGLGPVGEVGEDRVDLVADLLRAHVAVLRQQELHRDDRDALRS